MGTTNITGSASQSTAGENDLAQESVRSERGAWAIAVRCAASARDQLRMGLAVS
jgi:hypothetical protein